MCLHARVMVCLFADACVRVLVCLSACLFACLVAGVLACLVVCSRV